MATMFEYVPVPGSRLTKDEATVVGQVIDRLRKERKLTPRNFLGICQNPREAVHVVWDRIRKLEENSLDLKAANYLLRGVDVIEIRDFRQVGPPRKAVYSLQVNPATPTQASQTLTDALPEAQKNQDLIQHWVANFKRDLTRMVTDLENLVGEERAEEAVADVLRNLYPTKKRK